MFPTIILADAVRSKLPGVQVFEHRGALSPIPDFSADFKSDWIRLHERWKGKAKTDVEAFPPHAAFAAFYRQIGFDPKKNPPSVQNLIQRFLIRDRLDKFPVINPLVDAVNVAAVDSGIPLGVFDDRCVIGDLFLAFTDGGESFQPLGTPEPIQLDPGILVLKDAEKVLSQFCYRDGEAQKVTSFTRTFRLLGCQAPGIDAEAVQEAMKFALSLFERFATIAPAA